MSSRGAHIRRATTFPVRPHALLVVTVLVVAANLRPAITSVGPVIELVGGDRDLSRTALGVLGAIPLVTFGVVSLMVHRLSRHLGVDRTLLVALGVLTAATVVRSLPGFGGWLWIGTVLLAAAIAVGNVLVPSIVKRDFPTNVPWMTGAYSATLGGFAAVASGVAVPLSRLGGWELALGIWATLSLLATLFWSRRLPQSRSEREAVTQDGTQTDDRSMWSSAVAWQVTIFFGMQATTYYLFVTWLPSIEAGHGVSAIGAGWHLFFFQIVSIFASLYAGSLMRRTRSQRLVGVAVSALMIVAALGLVLAPDFLLLWDAIAGLSTGSALVVALTLIALRAPTARHASRLSGMAQSIGYLMAATGPVGAGIIYDRAISWTPVLIGVAIVATGQGVLALLAGRDVLTHRPAVGF
jgi:CP family cyanate transporter-like MFS transporter